MPAGSHSPAYDEAVAALVARLADNKYFLGRHYAEWCSSAPTLESAVAAAAMAQDELGHARALYPLLRTLVAQPSPELEPELEPETRTRFTNMAFLDRPFGGWQDFVAANFLIDTALTLVFAAAVTSSFGPLAGRARKVLQEERMHRMHADGWVSRLASEGSAVRAAFEMSMQRAWPETLCWFGAPGGSDTLSSEGVLDATPDELRARFLASVGPVLAAVRLNLPVRQTKSGSWELTEPLPWERWVPESYRLALGRQVHVTRDAAEEPTEL